MDTHIRRPGIERRLDTMFSHDRWLLGEALLYHIFSSLIGTMDFVKYLVCHFGSMALNQTKVLRLDFHSLG